jgi:hypothetical protein
LGDLAFLCPRNQKRSSPKIETLFIGPPAKRKKETKPKKQKKKKVGGTEETT